jgi:hypothetical protein
MGPLKSPPRPHQNQAAGRRKRRVRRPRRRRCLLKGCEQGFHPRQARQRYCSAECREAARKWVRWKAQQRYRRTAAGQQKRNGQSARYRERVKSRKLSESEAVSAAARVIPQEYFFSSRRAIGRVATKALRASGEVPCNASVAQGAGERWSALKNGNGAGDRRVFNPDILIAQPNFPYLQPVDATGVSSARPALGASARTPPRSATAVVGVAGGERPANAHCGGSSRRRPSRPLRGH